MQCYTKNLDNMYSRSFRFSLTNFVSKHFSACSIFNFCKNMIHNFKAKYFNQFPIKDFFSKFDQIRSFLRFWSHLLKKSLMVNFIFCAVLFMTQNYTLIQSYRIGKILLHFEQSNGLKLNVSIGQNPNVSMVSTDRLILLK